MGQLHQARQEAVVRQLVFTIEGVWGGEGGGQVKQGGARSLTLVKLFANV